MAEENEIFKQVLKHKGFFNFSELYNFCFDWLGDEGFKIAEKSYTEKVSGGGKEIIIEWEAFKRVTDYIKFVISIDWHIRGMKDAEVEREGKKENTNKGDLKMTFRGIFVRDYEDKWEKKPLWKFMRGIYDKYIIRTTIDEYQGRLVGKVIGIVKETKSFLQLEGN